MEIPHEPSDNPDDQFLPHDEAGDAAYDIPEQALTAPDDEGDPHIADDIANEWGEEPLILSEITGTTRIDHIAPLEELMEDTRIAEELEKGQFLIFREQFETRDQEPSVDEQIEAATLFSSFIQTAVLEGHFGNERKAITINGRLTLVRATASDVFQLSLQDESGRLPGETVIYSGQEGRVIRSDFAPPSLTKIMTNIQLDQHQAPKGSDLGNTNELRNAIEVAELEFQLGMNHQPVSFAEISGLVRALRDSLGLDKQ